VTSPKINAPRIDHARPVSAKSHTVKTTLTAKATNHAKGNSEIGTGTKGVNHRNTPHAKIPMSQ